jgi:citrate lyase subunit beta/citryl-CoA lyase
LTARLEAAINQLISTEKEYHGKKEQAQFLPTAKDRFRFSRLYLPGNSPSLMLNAGLHGPNGLILDLEDAVAFSRKDEARYLVRNALRNLNFYGTEKMVRINQVPMGIQDLAYIVPQGVNLILVPKCEGAGQIHAVNKEIDRLKEINGAIGDIWLMPIIESALGVIKAYEIASSADNIVAMAIGLEDYTADLGCRRSLDGRESFFARSAVVNACKAAGIQAIDSVFSDVTDMDGLAKTVQESKSLGFDGMGCIHPRQIKVIHENFAPGKQEMDKACKIVNAFDLATSKGLGVVSLGSKMIDPPVVKRAQKVVKLGLELGLLNENWRDSNE